MCQEFCTQGGLVLGGCLVLGVPALGGIWNQGVGSGPGGACSQGGACSWVVPGGDPPPRMATAVGGMHPTGMHSCLSKTIGLNFVI